MVGGYVILTSRPLTIGTNNMLDYYGSAENVNNRFLDIVRAPKPILVKYVDGSDVRAAWFELVGISGASFNMSSATLDIVFRLTDGTLVLSRKSE